MKVFISWSGERSQLYARELKEWLPRVIQTLEPWMSDTDIERGSRWALELGKNLETHNIGLICVTPENMDASWLMFEAGALSKSLNSSWVCPILFGINPSRLKSTPLEQFNAVVFNKEGIKKLLHNLNKLQIDSRLDSSVLDDSFKVWWPEFEENINNRSKIPIIGKSDCWNGVLQALENQGLPKPSICQSAHFSSGFETHPLYESLCSFTKNRLNIFGRKNRKLFDKEHQLFFNELKGRREKGFDFKCLFIDPGSPPDVLKTAHRDQDFKQQLENCIKNAISFLIPPGIEPGEICRTYQMVRPFHLSIVDNAVLYTPVQVDEYGIAKPLTRAPFTITPADEGEGKMMVEIFNEVWAGAKPISTD
ncbi:MAG: TIR domain-containing protein [Candidatus Aminicenantes bacterium]|nr:TIR domain-containing protein [Candidatus Aminicenantes bacterium]